MARGAWLPGTGTYTIENSTAPFDPTAGDIRFHPETPHRIDFKAGGDACGTIAMPDELLAQSDKSLPAFLHVASLANLATVAHKEDRWEARGDPTEIAIQVFSSRFGWNRVERTAGEKPEWSDVAELPFDSDVKRMSVIMKNNGTGELSAYTKGAVERVIQICTKYSPGDSGELADLTDEFRQEILRNMEVFASLGLRVLALAGKPYTHVLEKGDEVDRATVECDLVFHGLIGLYDPPRPESAPAVRSCHEAGISVHMLTGDHPETAKAIAIEVGILPTRMEAVARNVADAMVMTASSFDSLTDDQVDELPVLPLVIARCAPSTKVRMIEALHRRKRFCAMVRLSHQIPLTFRLLTRVDW